MIFRNTNIGQISFFGKWKDNFEAVLICLFDDCFTPKNISSNLQKITSITLNLQYIDVQGDSMYQSTWKSRFWKNMCSVRGKKWQMALFQMDSCIQFYRLTQLIIFMFLKDNFEAALICLFEVFHPKRTFQTNQNSFFILYIKFDNFAVWNYLTSS